MDLMLNRFNQAMQKIDSGKGQLEEANKDLWLTDNDKRNRRQAVSNDLQKEVEAASNEIWSEAIDNLADAHVDMQRSLKSITKTKERQERAAIMGPAYAAMSNDELLRVLDQKFDNDVERGLLLDYLEARAAGKEKEQGRGNLQAVEDPLQTAINKTINKNLDRLDGYPAMCVEKLKKAQDGELFARNAEQALKTEALKQSGQLQGENIIRRRDALNNITALKEKYKIVTHENQSGALPYSGPRAKRGTQRGR